MIPLEWINSRPKMIHPTKNSKLASHLTGLFLIEELIKAEVVPQIPASEVLHSHVEIFPILEGRLHVDDERTGDLLQNGLLIDNRANTLLQ